MTCFVCSRSEHKGGGKGERNSDCQEQVLCLALSLSLFGSSRPPIKQQASCLIAWGIWLDLPLFPRKGHKLQKDFRLAGLMYLNRIREEMHSATNIRPGRQGPAEQRVSLLRMGTKCDIKRQKKEWQWTERQLTLANVLLLSGSYTVMRNAVNSWAGFSFRIKVWSHIRPIQI